MKNLKLFIRAAISTLKAQWFIFSTDQIIVCSWCKKVLNNRPRARAISNGICFLCHFKQIGGRVPELPSLNSFAFVKALKGFKFEYTHPTWTTHMIHKGLVENGKILRRAELAKRSLTAEERDTVWAVRVAAALEGSMSKEFINALEMDGERMVQS